MQNSLLYLELARQLSRERWAEDDGHHTTPGTAPAAAPTSRRPRLPAASRLLSRQPTRLSLSLSSPMGCTS